MHILLSAVVENTTQWGGVGALLTGISEVLLALGAGFGFIYRYRQNAKKEAARIKEEATKAAKETADKLDQQYLARIAQYDEAIDRLQNTFDNTVRMYEEKLTSLQALNTRLVNQILKHHIDKQS